MSEWKQDTVDKNNSCNPQDPREILFTIDSSVFLTHVFDIILGKQ